MSQTQMDAAQSKAAVNAFFTAFGKGDAVGIINAFHEDCSIYAVRAGERKDRELYGTYKGHDGVKAFLGNLGNHFDTKAFSIEHTVAEGNVVFVNGQFTHQVKATGKMFSSKWSLMCIVKDGKILEYHFFEDSAAYVTAAAK